MWLQRVEIKNFRSIEDLSINFSSGINVIFGENGTGKTNIINAILHILGPTYPSPNSFDKSDHYCFDEQKDILIKILFSEGRASYEMNWERDSNNKWRLLLNEQYASDESRIRFCPLHIPPNREIKDLPGSSKWTPLGRIINELSFKISENEDISSRFKQKMEECKDILEESREFSIFKTRLESYSAEQLGNRGEAIRVKLDLLDHKHLLKTLQLFEELEEEQFNLSDGGQGVQSSVTMAAIRAFSDVVGGRFTIIADEPEAYLHPLAQKSLCNVFEKIALNGGQIILTTHSPHFISQINVQGLHKIWLQSNKTRCTSLDVGEITRKKTERLEESCTVDGTVARLQKIMSIDIREGLFGQTIVLCEGESEVNCLDVWNIELGFDFNKKGIALIASQGKFSMIDLAEFFENLRIPVYIIFDSDSRKTGDDRLKHLRNNRWLLQFAGENPTDFPDTTISDSYSVFSPDFESALRSEDGNYEPIEMEVNHELGLDPRRNKGIRAKYSALKYIEREIPPTDVIRQLLVKIQEFHQTHNS